MALRRALYRETPENEPTIVFVHGFSTESFIQPETEPYEGAGDRVIHQPMAIVEDGNGCIQTTALHTIKLDPSSATMVAKIKTEKDKKIIDPFDRS